MYIIRPLEWVLSLPYANQLKYIPGLRAALSRPLNVETVGDVIAHIAVNHSNLQSPPWKVNGILNVDDIYEQSQLLKKI